VDEEVVMPGGPRHAPKPRQAVTGGSPEKGREKSREEGRIADIIRPVVAVAGMDLESVRVSAAGRRRLLRVVVDSDQGVSLDDAAAISRQLSAALDTEAVMGDFPYTLEVSSPGVDRPLLDPRHWRRAVGRLVQVTVNDAGDSGVSGPVSGRVVAADTDGVTLDVEGARRRYGYPALGAGAVQVEFGPPQPELGATRDGH
jgi:ribosome maturation factor RimP